MRDIAWLVESCASLGFGLGLALSLASCRGSFLEGEDASAKCKIMFDEDLHIDYDDFTDPFPETGLYQQGHVENTSPVTAHPAFDDFPYHCTPHGRMHDTVEHLSFAFIVEYYLADSLAIQRYSVILENPVAKV